MPEHENAVSGDKVDFITAVKLNIDEQISYKLREMLDNIVHEQVQFIPDSNHDRKAAFDAMYIYVEKRINELANTDTLRQYIAQREKEISEIPG